MSIAEKLAAIAANQQKVFDAGVRREYDKFWDNFQGNGEKKGYNYAFYGYGWNDQNFRPKYDIKPTDFAQAFNGCHITDLAAILTDSGVTLDTSGTGGFSYSFYNSRLTHLPVISTVGAGKISYTFYQMLSLHTIDKVIFKDDGSQTFEYAFYCPALVNLTVEGVIGSNPSFGLCTKLSVDSLMSIINALKDYSGAGTTKTLSLGAANLGKLSAEQKQLATEKGWTLA